jgi:hypothetical protein
METLLLPHNAHNWVDLWPLEIDPLLLVPLRQMDSANRV